MTHRTSTDRKASAAIYREAARRVEKLDLSRPIKGSFSYGYACNAIQTVLRRDPLGKDAAETTAFKGVFSPGWQNEYGFFGPMEKAFNRDCRVLALCFMAAMVEAGDA